MLERVESASSLPSCNPRGETTPPGALLAKALDSVPSYRSRSEAEYAKRLGLLIISQNIRAYFYEPITLKLGHDCRYTPDFMVLNNDGTIELHEVKGRQRDDAMVKLKVAAEKYNFFIWKLVKKGKLGGWEVRDVCM